jgi:hypothetical protein
MRTPRPDDTLDLVDPRDYAFTRRTRVHARPNVVYDLVSNLSLMGEWSPTASEVRYDDGTGPHVGAWFSGRNARAGRTWTSRSQVCEADRGVAFGFVVGGLANGIVHWRWTFRASGIGTEVSQTWRLLRTDPLLGTTRGDLDVLRDDMARSVEATLLALARWITEDASGRAC